MAKITHLFGDTTRSSSPRGVKLALREWASIPFCFVLVAVIPFVAAGFFVMYLSSCLVHKLTGEYPLTMTVRLGEKPASDSAPFAA